MSCHTTPVQLLNILPTTYTCNSNFYCYDVAVDPVTNSAVLDRDKVINYIKNYGMFPSIQIYPECLEEKATSFYNDNKNLIMQCCNATSITTVGDSTTEATNISVKTIIIVAVAVVFVLAYIVFLIKRLKSVSKI